MADATGKFFWYELMTPDTGAAQSFYSSVVGWTPKPYDGEHDYTVLYAGEAGVGGIMAAPEGAPHTWIGYVSAADTDASADAVTRAGGKVMMAPHDVSGVGRMAAVTDPQGAGFMVMTPFSTEKRPEVAPNTPGHIGWHELHTNDWKAALDFYSGRFGWKKEEAMDMGAMGTYQIIAEDGHADGAMFNSPNVPHPMWLFYFNVASVDASVDRINAGGGKVINGPMQVPGGGWIVQATDPQGVMFAIVGPK